VKRVRERVNTQKNRECWKGEGVGGKPCVVCEEKRRVVRFERRDWRFWRENRRNHGKRGEREQQVGCGDSESRQRE